MNNQTDLAVRKEVEVACPVEKAFDFFVKEIGSWWPLDSKSIGESRAVTAVIEPEAGGRWFEKGEDGVECDWGRVLEYERPHHLALSWQIGADFKYDESVETRLDFDFSAVDERTTKLVVIHSGLESYGPAAGQMQAIFDSPDGWSDILERFAGDTEA